MLLTTRGVPSFEQSDPSPDVSDVNIEMQILMSMTSEIWEKKNELSSTWKMRQRI